MVMKQQALARVQPHGTRPGRFASAILPAWCRRSPQISEVLPLPYLHGLSSLDFVSALEQYLGSSAGLSEATVHPSSRQLGADWEQQVAPNCAERGSNALNCAERLRVGAGRLRSRR
jgi:hypothetical protein